MGHDRGVSLHFGLADRRDLPGVEELKASGLIGPRPVTLAETAKTLPFTQPDELPQRDELDEADEPDDDNDTE